MCENSLKYWNFNAKTWYIFLRISVLGGIYYEAGKLCDLICCDKEHVLGWYVCRYEHSGAWETLMSRIAEPKVVVSDGGMGFRKALKRK